MQDGENLRVLAQWNGEWTSLGLIGFVRVRKGKGGKEGERGEGEGGKDGGEGEGEGEGVVVRSRFPPRGEA